MSVVVNAGLDQATNMAKGAIDGGVEALDASQNAVLESGVNVATMAEELGDLTMDRVKAQAAILKTMIDRYSAAVKKVADGLPLP